MSSSSATLFPFCSYQFVNRQTHQMFLPTSSISNLYEGFKAGRIMRITMEGPCGLCTLEITNTPNTFTHQYEHAAELLNRLFVGYSKHLEICITQTLLCEQNGICGCGQTRKGRVKFTCNSSV